MIQLPFDTNMELLAIQRGHEMGGLANSITSGSANAAAFLGEMALAYHLGADIVDTYNHDLIVRSGGKKHTIEVKTKRRTVDPKPHYEVSVAKTSSHQSPDYYAFLSITFLKFDGEGRGRTYYHPQRIWLCGYYPGEKYWQDAIPMNKGQVDHSNGFRTHVAMYNLKISDLLLS